MQKYQDNYNLSCFLRKVFPEENGPASLEAKENSSTSHNKDRVSRQRFKVVPPVKPIQPVLRKEEQQMVTNEELDELQNSSHRKLRDIEGVIKESKTNREKLDKIAAISLSFAKAGADIVAPSDMMDGRIAAIKSILRKAKLENKVHQLLSSS